MYKVYKVSKGLPFVQVQATHDTHTRPHAIQRPLMMSMTDLVPLNYCLRMNTCTHTHNSTHTHTMRTRIS